jgi:hypothetical protein
MADESSHNNPRDEVEETFSKMEEQVIDISHNMPLLMVALGNMFGHFWEVGVSNSKVGLDEKS